MIIVKLQGGLGNQLFQWAFGLSRSIKSDVPLKFDVSSYKNDQLRKLEIQSIISDVKIASEHDISQVKGEKNLVSILLRKIKTGLLPYYKRRIICEPNFTFDENISKGNFTDNYFDGYWPNEKYFSSNRELILNKINFGLNKSKEFSTYKALISKKEYSVSIHVRRGDFVNNPVTLEVHGICDIEYYQRSVKLMENEFDSCHFFVFSNGMDWCKANFKFIKNVTFVDQTTSVFEDLELMSLAKGQIIANSSLSWWSAWLNNNPYKKIIAPVKWLKKHKFDSDQIVPTDWIRL